MRSRMWSRLIPCALLLLPAAADIPNPIHGAIQVYAALAGRFAFIQPDGTLTVLDATTGTVLFRGEKHIDERYTWSSFFDTPHGLVVRSYRWKLFTRDENVYRRLDFGTQTVAWEIASTRECHVGDDHLICPDWRGRLVRAPAVSPRGRTRERAIFTSSASRRVSPRATACPACVMP